MEVRCHAPDLRSGGGSQALIAQHCAHPAPDSFVELHIQAHIAGVHHLLRKLADLLHSEWCPLLEALVVQFFVQVDGVLPGYCILRTALLVDHLRYRYTHPQLV